MRVSAVLYVQAKHRNETKANRKRTRVRRLSRVPGQRARSHAGKLQGENGRGRDGTKETGGASMARLVATRQSSKRGHDQS